MLRIALNGRAPYGPCLVLLLPAASGNARRYPWALRFAPWPKLDLLVLLHFQDWIYLPFGGVAIR